MLIEIEDVPLVVKYEAGYRKNDGSIFLGTVRHLILEFKRLKILDSSAIYLSMIATTHGLTLKKNCKA